MPDVRELLADAQAAEARGEKTEAIALLRRAAELYRDSQNPTRALKMLRHIRRLEGLPEDDGPELSERVLEERAPSLAPPELDAWCSFCCRPKREVGPLVAGPTGTFICQACTGMAQVLLGGAPAPLDAPARPVALPHQQAAWSRVSRAGAKLALLLGPAGSGRTTLLAALSGPNVAVLDLEAPLQSLPSAARVVIAVPAEAPPAPLVVAGQPVYDTATLVAACGALVPEPVLARVDAVGVLPAFDAVALRELGGALGVKDDVDALVGLALKSPRPARELRALIARLSP